MQVPIPDCSHRPTCPGCPHFAEAGLAPATADRLAKFARDTAATLAPLSEGTPHGYRQRARLMVRGRAASPKIGLFQAGSHRIADIPGCPIQHPLINSTAAMLKAAMRKTGCAPYSDTAHRGLVRALQVVVERSTQRAQVVVVTNSAEPSASRELLDALRHAMGPDLHSLWWNGNPVRSNAILGPHWFHAFGPEMVEEHIGGARVLFPPGAFGQSHLALADRIVEAIHARVPAGARVAEYYAGCGAIGLGLLVRGHPLWFNESSPAGLAGLQAAIAALAPAQRRRARVAGGPAGSFPHAIEACDVAIADPPRKGLDVELRVALAQRPPRRLLYLSCDLGQLVRDTAALVSGRLRLAHLEPFALFPFTEHVETLAVFERD